MQSFVKSLDRTVIFKDIMRSDFSTLDFEKTTKTTMSRTELLAPAGSFEALCAAIEGGADAVYMGGVAFNARINAKNFTAEEMRRAISLAHLYGVKVYIAANTLIYDREKSDFLRAAEDAYLAGADALILADLGCAELVRRRIPIEIHASTQMSGHGVSASRELARLGFSRMVCAREMSKEDIRTFIENSEIEAEVFVHGALCVCHSGQCLFSSLVGQRSGNRGECAQPCRLPYRTAKGEGYPLSLKDLSLAEHVPELCNMGVASFKIEGRMKSPEYVRDVTRIWRRLIDQNRAASADEMRELEAVFSRQGFTDGYFTGRIDKKMLGVRREENKENSRNLQKFEKIERKIPVRMEARVAPEEPSRLRVYCDRHGVVSEVLGDVPDVAHTRPIEEEAVIKSLGKLGSTVFYAKEIKVEIEGAPILSVSSLNALRRSAVDKLEESIAKDYLRRSEKDLTNVEEEVAVRCDKPVTSAAFVSPSSVTESAKKYFDIIYLPIDKYDGSVNGVSMPAIVFDSELNSVTELLVRAKALGAKHLLVHNLGQFELARSLGFTIHAGIRLNACNRNTVKELLRLGASEVLLSPELTLSQIRGIQFGAAVCVYGRIPLMITEKCVSKEISDCRACEAGRVELVDRRSVRFPVLQSFEHRSEIYNSVPIYMADKLSELPQESVTGRHFVFSVERSEEIDRIITAYEKRTPPSDNTKIRRIK